MTKKTRRTSQGTNKLGDEQILRRTQPGVSVHVIFFEDDLSYMTQHSPPPPPPPLFGEK